MNPGRFQTIISRFSNLCIAVVGDYSLDRYLEIDPTRSETSIETGLPVYNVVKVRSQPGAAGTILNNLCALGIGRLIPVGFCGHDGEGFELMEALRGKAGVVMDHFIQTPSRCTFTYCKPLLIEKGGPPRELSRLDQKNWSRTPATVQRRLAESLRSVSREVDAVVIMDQVDHAGTGVVTSTVLKTVESVIRKRGELPIIADSRRGLGEFPRVIFKMNAAELRALSGGKGELQLPEVRRRAARLARDNRRMVFVTLAEHGIVGAEPGRVARYSPAHPVTGPIDIVGAGDAVTANIAAALAAGARLREAMEFGNAAASIAIHQLGTTGTASVEDLRRRLLE